MKLISALFSGLLFGIGLILSGMTDPAKVIGFLDIGGRWDPSLAFVMGGALLVGLLAFPFAASRQTAWLGEPMRLPTARQIDRPLIVGALLFGAGWGLAGYCPGPALTSVLYGGAKPLVFVLAMLVGIGLFEALTVWQQRRADRATPQHSA